MNEIRNQEINNTYNDTNVLIHLAGRNGNTYNTNDKGMIFSCERKWECGEILNDTNLGIHWTQCGVSLYPWCTSQLRWKEETISGKAGNLSISLWIANSDPPMHSVSLNWPPSFDSIKLSNSYCQKQETSYFHVFWWGWWQWQWESHCQKFWLQFD